MSETSVSSNHAGLRTVRKGTKSCVECRYRKIRCVFRPNNPSTCVSCFSHGIRCASQAECDPISTSHPRISLSERVALLEKELAVMRAQSDVVPSSNGPTEVKTPLNGPARPANSLHTPPGATFPVSSSPLPALECLPVLSLFDNDILTSNRASNILNDSMSREFRTGTLRPESYENSPHFRKSRIKRAKICEALTELLPSLAAMHEILETGGIWWDLLRKLHPYTYCEDEEMSIQNYAFLALNQDNPVVIGCAVSWLAMSLQCLPPGPKYDHLGLPLPLQDLTQHYVSTIDQLIVSDDELAVSLEGIECIMLQGQFYGNVGRPRKGWAAFRRALSHAVLLGLHRSPPRVSITSSPHYKRRESVWWHLVQCDAYLSLLLGLPSFTIPTPLDSETGNITSASEVSSEDYRRKLALLVGRISQRNQAMPTSLGAMLPTTTAIDRDLEALSSHLQPHSWNTSNKSSNCTKVPLQNHDDVITYFWHYQAKSYLHLPFMLQGPVNRQFDYSRTACTTASRETVQLYIRMRELVGGRISLCRTIEFQAFTATVILILSLLGMRPISAQQDITQDADDWNLVHRTMEALREAAQEPENMVAAQCFQALQILVSMSNGETSAEGNLSGRKIFIPYFGMISVTPGSKYIRVPASGNAQHLEKAASQPAAGAQAQNATIEINAFNTPFHGNTVQNLDRIPPTVDFQELRLPDALSMDIDQDWSWMLNSDSLNWQEQ